MKYTKGILLGLLVVLCMSVAVAADVSEDTLNDITITPNDYEISDISSQDLGEVSDSDNSQQVTPRSNGQITSDVSIDSSYDNQTWDVSGNVKITSNVAQSNNIAFNLNGNNITIDGLNIVNDETQPIAINAIQNSQDINIINTNITIVNTEETETMGIVLNNTQNVLVENCTVDISAVSQDLYTPPDWTYSLKTSGILVNGGNNITLNDNVVNIANSTNDGSISGTGEAITVRSNANHVNIVNNIITGHDFPYTYGIKPYGVSNLVLIENNTINLNSGNYICGIQLTSTSNSILRRNTITGTCFAESGQCYGFEAFAYGIVISSSYKPTASESTNNLIEFNNIDITANVTYGIELNIADNTRVFNNTVDVDGEVVMALGMYNSSYCQIKDNNFTVTGNTRTLNNSIYEAIPPVTTGIKIVCDENDTSQYNTISGNRINVEDTNNTNLYSIILGNRVNNNVVIGNHLRAGNKYFVNQMISNNGTGNTINGNDKL
ncbi:hypothetical protein [Methanosphaera sp.]|uniref:hypothetical protein n=1 Tax=Methanosphaera sp. TaxID=2666342 RepID=UPI002E7A2BDA|nr:hypothetical protein [Methanosphaera sp.]MEE1117749.1 hypothetical protein [Methanosphaera sp.]